MNIDWGPRAIGFQTWTKLCPLQVHQDSEHRLPGEEAVAGESHLLDEAAVAFISLPIGLVCFHAFRHMT